MKCLEIEGGIIEVAMYSYVTVTLQHNNTVWQESFRKL